MSFPNRQVLDYYIYMKCNDGEKMFEQLFILLRLQLLLEPYKGYRGYIRPTIAQLLILLHQRRHNIPAWQMLVRDASIFNEETGEMSFSVLSRCVQDDTMKSKHAHLDNMYRMVPYIMSVDQEITDDHHGANAAAQFNWRRVAKKESETCQAMIVYMKGMCRATAQGVRQQYNGKDKHSKCYKNKAEGNKCWVLLEKKVPFWRNSVTTILAGDILATKSYSHTNFGCDHVHIWPEMKYGNHHAAVVQAGGEDGDEEPNAQEGGEVEDVKDEDDQKQPLIPAEDAVALAIAQAADYDDEEAGKGEEEAGSEGDGEGDEGEEEGDEGDGGEQSSSDDENGDGDDQMSDGEGRKSYKGQPGKKNKRGREEGMLFRAMRRNRMNKAYDPNYYYEVPK